MAHFLDSKYICVKLHKKWLALFAVEPVHTERQIDRQSHRQTDRQTDRETDKDRQTDRQTDDKTDRETKRKRDRQTQSVNPNSFLNDSK